MSSLRCIPRLAALGASLLLLALSPTASAPAQGLNVGPTKIGCVPHAQYDRLFAPGVPIPHVTLDRFVPQGLTSWAKHNWLIVSFYDPRDDDTQESRISLIDRASGGVAKDLRLSGVRSHAGGVAVGGGYLWLASGKAVYRYGLDDLERASASGSIPGTKILDLAFDAAYLTVADGSLWVGTFVEPGTGTMYRYRMPGAGTLVPTTPAFKTPPRVQGVVVKPNYFIYSTSYGRHNSSRLVTTTRSGVVERVMLAPAMAEGVAQIGDEFYVVYESRAKIYMVPDGDGVRPCKPPILRIQHTPVANLLPG